MWKIAKDFYFFFHLLYLMQSALAKCTALLLIKAVLSFSSLPALELLQRDKVLHGSLTHTVVISQSRLAPCPTKHKLPWSLQLFHGNTTVINTANNRSNPFHISPLSTGKDSIAPSPWTCANCWAWKEIETEIALPSARALGEIKEKKRHWNTQLFSRYFCLKEKTVTACTRHETPKSVSSLRLNGGANSMTKRVQHWVESLSPREPLQGVWSSPWLSTCASAGLVPGFQGLTAGWWFCT